MPAAPKKQPSEPEELPSGDPAAPRVRRGRKDDRRAVILEAARRRFAEFGFEATTVRQIAEDVNILSGSLYHHFDTKEAMLDEIVRGPVLAMHDTALRIAALPLDAETRLVTLIAAELDALTRHREQTSIVYSERKFFRRSPYFAYLMKARGEGFAAWASVLADGVRDGMFHGDIDEFLMISTVMRMLNTGADWFRNEDGSPRDVRRYYPFEELLAFYLGFVLRAVRTPARAGEPIPAPHAVA
jgi:AcrR family transcriptional regulator